MVELIPCVCPHVPSLNMGSVLMTPCVGNVMVDLVSMMPIDGCTCAAHNGMGSTNAPGFGGLLNSVRIGSMIGCRHLTESVHNSIGLVSGIGVDMSVVNLSCVMATG